MKSPLPDPPSLDALQSLLSSARDLVDELLANPLFERLVAVFAALPESDRDPILRVLERDATWRRIIAETAGPTGITVRPNPHASLYVHVIDDPGPSPRDIEVIRFGIERFVPLLPLFFQEGVHEQWTRSARELARAAPPELRQLMAQLAREVLGLVTEAENGREPD